MIKDIVSISHRGTRYYMEDDSCLVRNFGGHKDWIFGGVFDGHAQDDHSGAAVANLAAKNLPDIFLNKLKQGLTEKEAFKESYQEISDHKEFGIVGCCALSFFLKEKELFVANAGDCRMIIVYKKWIDQITKDHRVSVPEERERIKKLGGKIHAGYAFKGNNGLMPTRTLGDNYFKDIGIIAEPEVFEKEIPNIPGLYFIAATDGVWDEMDNEAVAQIAREANSSEEAANFILDILLTLRGSMPRDNISIIVART